MDESGSTLIEAPVPSVTIRKRRSSIPRRPRPEIQVFPQSYDPSTPVSYEPGRVSSEETDVSSGGKMFSLNQCISRGSPATIAETDYPNKRVKDDMESRVPYSNSGPGEDTYRHLSPTGHLGAIHNGVGNDNKLKKVKLKLGGVTRTIQAKSNPHDTYGIGSSTKSSRPHDTPRPRQKFTLQENSGEGQILSDTKIHYPTKALSRGIDSCKEGIRKMSNKSSAEKSDSVRKSKRVPKRRVLDEAFDEDDEDDDEIRYLEKLKTSKAYGVKDFEEENSNKHRSLSQVVSKSVGEIGKLAKDGKKRLDKGSDDTDYEEEEILLSDGDCEGKRKQKQRRDSPPDTVMESKRELALTTRQRALLSSKDPSVGVNQVEFPNGLPPPPSRKQKEKLTEVEQQLKKTEAAHRRKLQNEKAARESEAEAIRKILGQDSSRKKKEDKAKKRQEELAQEKAAKHQVLASETVRIVMRPTGTVVTFPIEMGFPPIFESKPCSYPAPREKCAGPSCLNPYKYRDSKLKLPLCSLNCYKAIHSKMDAGNVPTLCGS